MGSKKRFFGRGGNRKKRAGSVVRPYKVRWKICGCTDALQLLPDPHPSASQTPSPEGKAFRCGGDLGGQGRPPLRVRRKIGGCTVLVKWCLTAIIKIACGA